MRTARKLIAFADAVNVRVGRMAAWLVLAMTVVVFAMIVLSSGFRLGWVWMRESVTYMHGILFMGAAGYTLLRGDHVRIDVFYAKFSPRKKAWVEILGFALLMAPACLLILWTSIPYVWESWRVLERSDEASGIPALFLLKTFLILFPALMLMQGFSLALRGVLVLRGDSGVESKVESEVESGVESDIESEEIGSEYKSGIEGVDSGSGKGVGTSGS